MRNRPSIAIQLIVVAALLAVATRAYPQPTDDAQRAEVKRHYDAGLAHFNLREYKQAIDEFQAAYRLRPDPVFLYNLGQAYRLADDPEQAIYFYRAYLRTSDNPPNRPEVESRIATLEKLLSDKKKVAVPPDHALAPSTVSPSPPPTASATTSPPLPSPAPEHTPVYKRWWLWTAVGVVVAGAAVGLGVGLAEQRSVSFNANVGTVGPGALTVRY